MGMEGSGGMSPADVVALQGRNNDGMFSGNGTWIWVFFLFFLLAALVQLVRSSLVSMVA